jgi:hypothetical protein
MIEHSFITENLELKISEKPFLITEITDRKSGKVYCKNGRMSLVTRSPEHISDASLLYILESFKVSGNEISLTITDETAENHAELNISDSPYGIRFNLHLRSSEIIWLAEWKLSGFDLDNVIVPALGGQVLSRDMTPETTLSYKYPFWWNAQFVIGESGNSGIWMHTKDKSPDLKLLRVRKAEEDFHLSLGFESPAPLNSNQIKAEWFLDSYQKDWKKPVDIHRIWLEKNFNLHKLEENPHAPDWIHNINFILELWGMRKDQPEPHHTFEQMIERIKHFSEMHSPENTLLYLPGFAENGIDSHAPDYNPSIKCGGEEKFRELINTAHNLGYKVMVHTNVLALTFNHPLFKKFEKFQVVDAFNRKLGWAMDIDGDWLPEEYFAYVNPGFTEWGDHMQEVIGKLINEHKTDAVFLDQTLLAFNISNGPNFLVGMRDHVRRLQDAFPGTLFAGEGLNEQVLSSLPFAQIHGIDSLTEVHGMEGRKKWRKVHPVSVYLFGKYTRFSGHLLTKYPRHPMFKFQENAYSKLDVIPTLSIYDYKQKMDIPEVRKMLRRAKRLKKYSYEINKQSVEI